MREQMISIIQLAKETEELLIIGGTHRRSIEEDLDTDVAQTMATIEFLREARRQASEGELLPSIESKIEYMVNSYGSLPISEREPAFRCVNSYQACKAEAKSRADKVLCGIALAICFAKEVIPLA